STQQIRVDRRRTGTDTTRRIGRYEIPIELFQGVQVEVKTLVVPEGGQLPSDEELETMAAAELAAQQAAAPPESAAAEEWELVEEEVAPTARERAETSARSADDFDASVEAAAENQ